MIEIETEVTILINRKSDLNLIKEIIIDRKIQFPIYVFEYESYFKLTFTSDYAEWELDATILNSLPNYEFTSNPEKGRKEIRLQITRYQSELESDGWGRPIQDPLNETKYLVRKSKNQNEQGEKFNPKVKVLFENQEIDYYVNIIDGVEKNSGKKGYLILNEFKTNERKDETEFFKDRLYSSPSEAFLFGFYKMQNLVSEDFKDYTKNKKKELTKQRRKPRKIIRDFIKACNNFEIEAIIKALDEEIIFQKAVQRESKIRIKGIKEFENYIKSSDQEFCSRELVIRSSWDFNSLNNITIGIKRFYENSDSKIRDVEYIGRINFIIENDKIISIREEN